MFGPKTLLVLLALAWPALSRSHAQDLPGGSQWPEADPVRSDRALIYDTNLGLVERATREAVDQALDGLKVDPGSDIRLHSLTNHEAAWFVEDIIARALGEKGYRVHLVKPEVRARGTTPKAEATPGPAGDVPDLKSAMQKTQGTARDSTEAPGDTAAAAVADSAGATPGPARRKPPAKVEQASSEPEEIIPIPEGEGLVLTFRLIQFGVTYHDSWRRGLMGPRVVERLASVNIFCRLVSGSAEDVKWVGQGKSERLDIVPQAKLDLLEGLSYPFTRPELRREPLTRYLEPVLVTGIIGGLVYLFYTNQE